MNITYFRIKVSRAPLDFEIFTTSFGCRRDINKSTSFFMVCSLIDHIKSSKLKRNHDPRAAGFTAKFATFYGIISMVYKSVDHETISSIRFLKFKNGIDFIFRFEIDKTKCARVAMQIASFSWSVLSLTITLNQSARVNSESFVKKQIYCG